MQRILNDPDNIVDEMLSGFLKANSDIKDHSSFMRTGHRNAGYFPGCEPVE